jgi:hypothetical protein
MSRHRSSRTSDPFTSGAVDRLDAAVMALPGVTAGPHRFGGVEYRRGVVELGHTHTDGRADIRVGPAERDRLHSLEVAEENVWAPEEEGWVTVPLRSAADEETAIAAFRFAFDAAI